MGGLIEPLLNIGIEKATAETAENTKKITLIENIRNLMETTKWSAQQAMDALKIPPDEQSQYLPLI